MVTQPWCQDRALQVSGAVSSELICSSIGIRSPREVGGPDEVTALFKLLLQSELCLGWLPCHARSCTELAQGLEWVCGAARAGSSGCSSGEGRWAPWWWVLAMILPEGLVCL